jgi:Flp pilus assembly pilin Flp
MPSPRRRSLSGPDRGGAFLEYVVIAGVVALFALTALQMFGRDVSEAIHGEGIDLARFGL